MTKQFKVGDKVRVVKAETNIYHNGYKNGDIFTVEKVYEEGVIVNGGNRSDLRLHRREIELISPTPKKPNRMLELEARVDEQERKITELQAKIELIAQVEALQKRRKPATVIIKSPNESRKATIERAKAFVAENLSKNHPNNPQYWGGIWFTDKDGALITKEAEFIVNGKKGTVVALIRHNGGDRAVVAKGIAKCAPDDVFNADIGKAIALGRALGEDVSEFENAVKPTEVVVGVVARHNRDGDVYTFEGVREGYFYDMRHSDGEYYGNHGVGFDISEFYTIIDDTEAQYD